ncbi:hypothetical protein HAT86_11850 [Roseovarius gahaiensis]|uniref:Uncharacterized protein n=1 Tax=Roseovarius gahaiensis TaxID=2716691 RepID=A0A967BF30_9RHOB|nr:hypothetical protein [Roseovarius gahaiensis]NHQ75149.1 hypothetical protein [Roseovarius gahaiensis]
MTHINVSSGTDVSILELVQMVAAMTWSQSRITTDVLQTRWNHAQASGYVATGRMSWPARIGLEKHILSTYDWFPRHGSGALRAK